MTDKELLNCLTDRPCAVCKFHEEKGCTEWDCVFDQREQEPILDKIRAEIETIEISGMVDANTMYTRSAGQIKNIVIEIIDKYREPKPKTDTWSIKEVADALERHGLLEQEPKKDVLDRIRAEIEEAVWEDVVVSLDGADETRIPRLDPDDVLEIIDKYRGAK